MKIKRIIICIVCLILTCSFVAYATETADESQTSQSGEVQPVQPGGRGGMGRMRPPEGGFGEMPSGAEGERTLQPGAEGERNMPQDRVQVQTENEPMNTNDETAPEDGSDRQPGGGRGMNRGEFGGGMSGGNMMPQEQPGTENTIDTEAVQETLTPMQFMELTRHQSLRRCCLQLHLYL